MKKIFGFLTILSLSSLAFAANSPDKDIFDALINVKALALPTAFPYAGYDKHVGRLSCRHLINTQTQIETYDCDLTGSANPQDKDIFDALANVPAYGLPTAYPYVEYQKHVARLYCGHSINTQTSAETHSCVLQGAN